MTPCARTGRGSSCSSPRTWNRERFETEGDDRVVVHVHQVVHNMCGELVSDRQVEHVYTIRDGLIERMDVRET